MRLDEDVDHVAVLIHGTPYILLLAVDSNEDLVQVPVVAEPTLTPLHFPRICSYLFATDLSHKRV
jgi:hypothetical protein